MLTDVKESGHSNRTQGEGVVGKWTAFSTWVPGPCPLQNHSGCWLISCGTESESLEVVAQEFEFLTWTQVILRHMYICKWLMQGKLRASRNNSEPAEARSAS